MNYNIERTTQIRHAMMTDYEKRQRMKKMKEKRSDNLRLRWEMDKQRINAKTPHQHYAIQTEQQAQLLCFHPTVSMIFNVVLMMIGGNCLLAANATKRLLVQVGSIEWETSLMRNFALNAAIAVGIGVNLVMCVPSIKLTKKLGPCWTTTCGFVLYSIACYQLSRRLHAFVVWLSICVIGVSTSFIFHGLAIHMHVFGMSNNEVFGLSFFTLAESFSVAVPVIMQNCLDMRGLHDVPPYLSYGLAVLLLFCGLFSSLYLSSWVPTGVMDEGEHSKMRRLVATHSCPNWSSFFQDQQSRVQFSPEFGQPRSEEQIEELQEQPRDQNSHSDDWESEDNGEDKKEEIVAGDIHGTLLYSTKIDERELPHKRRRQRLEQPVDDPLYWRCPLAQKVARPQFLLICVCLTWIQFVCLDYSLTSFDIIQYQSKTAEVALHYQALFELFIPLGQFLSFALLNIGFPNLCLNWQGLTSVLALMCLTTFVVSILSRIPMVFLQLITFSLIGILWSLVKSFPIAAISYLFGPKDFYSLLAVTSGFRGFACIAWIFWQDFCSVNLKSEMQLRFQYMQNISGCVCLLAVFILYWEPEVTDFFNVLDEPNVVSPTLHPPLAQQTTSSARTRNDQGRDLSSTSRPPAGFQRKARRDVVQPRIKASVLAIGTLPDDIILYQRGKIISKVDVKSAFELMDVFGRTWNPQ